MTTTAATSIEGLASPADVLDFARWCRTEADRFEANLMLAAVTWAEQHPPESIALAATWSSPAGDTGMVLAGPGAPLVSSPSSRWRSGAPPTPDGCSWPPRWS